MTHRRSIAALLFSTGLTASGAMAQEATPAGGPANLCQELVAFVRKPEEKKQEAATPAAQSTAVSNPSGKSEGQPSSGGGQPQQNSGLSGPTKPDTQGSAAGTPTLTTPPSATSGKAALAQANAAAKTPPAPAAPAPSPKLDEALLARIDAASAANDQVACRAAARTLRVMGVIMPPPLLALAALDPKFHTGNRP